MSKGKIVLITGVAGYWGRRVAERLSTESDLYLIGVDKNLPAREIDGLDFIQADIRNPLLIELLQMEEVDTICHLAFMENRRPNEAAFDLNVMGTMKVMGAAAEAGVKKVVLKSSTTVYGAHATNSAFLKENDPLKGSRQDGATRHLMEIEAFSNGFARQHPELQLTILRFPSVVGPTADTPMTRFLKRSYTPTLLGFDPLFQIIHEDDVVAALAHAVLHDHPGVYNIAAEGIMPFSRLIKLAGKIPIPVLHPLAYWGVNLLGGNRKITRLAPIELDYLRYSWVADTEKMIDEFGFTPHYTAEEALREFAGYRRTKFFISEREALAYDEERLRDTLERRRRARQRQESSNL